MIPRPETEGLVLLVKDIILSNKIKHDTILDVCTGSGCIALFMKGIFPDSKVYASDKSKDALEVAKINDEMWSELFLDNKDALLAELEELRRLKSDSETTVDTDVSEQETAEVASND